MTNFKSLNLAMNNLINQEKSLHSIKFDIHRLLIKLTNLSSTISIHKHKQVQNPQTETQSGETGNTIPRGKWNKTPRKREQRPGEDKNLIATPFKNCLKGLIVCLACNAVLNSRRESHPISGCPRISA